MKERMQTGSSCCDFTASVSLKDFRWNQKRFVNQGCWQAWVRPTRVLDRVRVKVCSGFERQWKKCRGVRFPFSQKRNSLVRRRSPRPPGEVYFRCPSVVCPQCPPKSLTKDPGQSDILPSLHHSTSVFTRRNAGAWVTHHGSQRDMLGKEQPFVKGPVLCLCVLCQFSIVY